MIKTTHFLLFVTTVALLDCKATVTIEEKKEGPKNPVAPKLTSTPTNIASETTTETPTNTATSIATIASTNSPTQTATRTATTSNTATDVPPTTPSSTPTMTSTPTLLPTEVLAYWPFDGSGANTSTWGSALNLTNHGADVNPVGKINQAFDFNGTSDYFSAPAGTVLNIGGHNVSITVWVNVANNTVYNPVFDVRTECTTGFAFDFYATKITSGKVHLNLHGAGICESVHVISANQWHHLGATYDGSHAKIYIDGVLDATCDLTGDMSTEGAFVSIGYDDCSNVVPHYFHGTMDELKIWLKALSPEEIAAEAGL